jgi:hypothetical protein
MDRVVIERRLTMHIFNLCLAVAGKKEGDIALCKDSLLYEVEKIARDAARDARARLTSAPESA